MEVLNVISYFAPEFDRCKFRRVFDKTQSYLKAVEFSVNSVLLGVVCCRLWQSDKAAGAFYPAFRGVAARVTGSARFYQRACRST